MKKKIISTGFVLAGVCLFAFFSLNAQSDNAVTDTSKVYKISGGEGMNGSTHTFVDGQEYNITIRKGMVTEMYIDSNKIPAEKIVDYKTVLDKIFYNFKKTQEQASRDKEEAENDKEQAIRDKEQAISDKEQAVRDKEQAVKDKVQAVRDKKQAVRDKEQAVFDKEQAVRDKEQARKDKVQALRDKEHAARDKVQAVRDKVQMEEIIKELISEKIIKNRKELDSFQLSNNELIVNGIKQSSIIHQRLSNKYLPNKSLTWMYNIEQ